MKYGILFFAAAILFALQAGYELLSGHMAYAAGFALVSAACFAVTHKDNLAKLFKGR